ncbi:hypothetical protein NDU88_001681 [Pleurodeles waltl]|uniref:Uncharacterized protein n=1 Tax=Pleurodeles waltl TaxID=8319 RepID=A0AAV7T087_PLEWA|nr:hypothetical protein NDU88_001681 [Pleurodeles waltl]
MQVRVPERVYGPQERGFSGAARWKVEFVGGHAVEAGAWVQYGAERTMDRFNTGTGIGRRRQGGDDPGKHDAARRPWGEEKAGPQAASWKTSPEEGMRPGRATDAPRRRCDGRGCAPNSIAFSGGQRPDASEGYRGLMVAPAVRSKDGEPSQRVSKGPVAWGQEVAGEDDGASRENSELDFGEESVEVREISEGLGEEEQDW